MVNKCSVTGCKSLYSKEDNVKVRLHRFPLSNPETLPVWIAATGREKDWKPCKSSRLCGNHFENSEYIIGHGKNVLKATSVPTIEYRVDVLRYNRRKSLNCCDMEQTNKSLKVEPVDSSDTNVEIVQLDYNDMYNLKYEQQNKGENYDHEESYFKNENEKCTKKNDHHVIKSENSYNSGDEASHDGAIKNEYEDSNYELKHDICNRENQCYMFTSSFKEGAEPIVLTPPEEPLNMNIDQTTADLNFKKIMDLKLKKQLRTKNIYSLYFKALKKKRFPKQEKYKNSFNNDDADSFAAFIGAQMKDLRPYRKVYLSAKHKIQKILMKAQLKITN
ncbi:THAP domain-containing protein 1-like isoform X1 [Metopolophium dirhodum]|uniref:THAP domain-containing protein 1-like isoform X1 n=1 Tax=Metopolophium dirhodum TaxID=44670 RepID=UPI00299009A1|nr:THAP domain-containing protein 1-like isoform X1 [Metopolophium dirhodum]